MHEQLRQPVQRLLARQNLTTDEVFHCIGAVMDGACDPIDIAAILTAMAVKGPVAEELVGAARAMRSRATVIRTQRTPLLDTCGTGGDGLHTFNISTATALTAAACGVNVAKHGNRGVSSSSGSADVLEALGVKINLTPEKAGQCLDEIGIAFCFAPLVHGAMKHAAPVRRQLGFPTIFNLLGPLTNPAGAQYQLLGASSSRRAELIASAISMLGVQRALVVCGNDELDEVCLWGPTTVFDVRGETIRRCEWTAGDFGLPECRIADLTVRSASESADVLREAFSVKTSPNETLSPAVSIIIANTAAALVSCERFDCVGTAADAARQAIASGAAGRKLKELIDWTSQNAD